MFALLQWQPNFIHYFEHLVVMNSLCRICLLAVEPNILPTTNCVSDSGLNSFER